MVYAPSAKQLRFLDWEVGMFFHFGIRSFYPGHTDWDGREMDARAFNPTELDVHAWLRAAKLIGAKYCILTTKHHDGFALWPSECTPYSVAASPWKNGKGDVVGEFVSACREEGLGVGLYYSPAQWGGHGADFTDPVQYDDYFIGQISELLTNYGKIDYLWFDGCGSNGHEYDQRRIVSHIRALQPDIMLFDMWDADTRWVGNEEGYAPYPNPYAVKHRVLGEEKTLFLPAECDCKIRDTWFYDLNADTIKPTEKLMDMYECSVGRGSNLLLNVGPDARGLIDDSDLEALRNFGGELKRRYGEPKPFCECRSAGKGRYEISCESDETVNAVIIREDITRGQTVKRFELYGENTRSERFHLFSGETVGHKLIVKPEKARLSRIVLTVTEGGEAITDIKAY